MEDPPQQVPDADEYRMEAQELEPLPPAELEAIFTEIEELTARNRAQPRR